MQPEGQSIRKESRRGMEFRLKGTKSGGGTGMVVRWREDLKIGGRRRKGSSQPCFSLIYLSGIALLRR